MSATTAPPEDKVAGAAADATESFIKVIGHKIRAGWQHSKAFFVRSGKAAKNGTVKGAKTSWRWGKAGVRGVALGVSWALMWVGRLVYGVVRAVGVGLVYALDFVLLVLVAILTGIVWVVETVLYLVIKVGQFVGLVLATCYLAMTGGKSLVKDDWELFWYGLRFHNWSTITPGSLALRKVRQEETTRRQRTAESNGQGSRPAVAKQAAKKSGQTGKGRPTPRRSTRRSPRLRATGATA